MCTATWSVGANKATLCFNRDERKDRARALPPMHLKQSEVSCLAPIDGEAGGTWLLVNDLGLCVFVLNCYVLDPRGETVDGSRCRSRGMLPLALADCRDVKSGISMIGRLNLSDYRPVYIGLLDKRQAVVYRWDGRTLEEQKRFDGFITTSSFEPQLVEAYRKSRFEELIGMNAEARLQDRLNYHQDLAHDHPAFNPFMSREEAETQSISVVEIDAGEARIQYLERKPGEIGWREPVHSSLKLRLPE